MPLIKRTTPKEPSRRRSVLDPHGIVVRIIAGSCVGLGLIICVLGYYDTPIFRAGVILAVSGNALRLVNFGSSIREEEQLDKSDPRGRSTGEGLHGSLEEPSGEDNTETPRGRS